MPSFKSLLGKFSSQFSSDADSLAPRLLQHDDSSSTHGRKDGKPAKQTLGDLGTRRVRAPQADRLRSEGMVVRRVHRPSVYGGAVH